MLPRLHTALAVLLALPLLAGCGSGSHPLARVGERTLTTDDLAFVARESRVPLGENPSVSARPLLDAIVSRELLLVGAHAHGTDSLLEVKTYRKNMEDGLLRQAIFDQLAPDDIGVSDAEAHELWRWREQVMDVAMIYAPDLTSLHIAQSLLATGMPFAQVADRINPPGGVPPGGAVGTVAPGQLGLMVPGSWPVLDRGLLTLADGQVGGPYTTSLGYFLLQPTHHHSANRPPFEQDRPGLVELLRQERRPAVLYSALADLARGYHLQLRPDGTARLFRLLSAGRVGVVPPWMPSPSELREPLATWDGGQYTLDDAVQELRRSDVQQPNPALTTLLARWLDDRCKLRVVLAEARRRHLDEEPDFHRFLQAKIDDYVLRAESGIVSAGVREPKPEELRALWDRMKPMYPMLAQATVRWTVVPDTVRAQAILAAANGRGLVAAAAAQTPPVPVATTTLRFPNVPPDWASAQEELSRMRPGQVAGPEPNATGWRIVELVDAQTGTREWDQLTPDQQRDLEGQVMQRAYAARFQAYTDSLKHAVHPYAVLPENLRWVTPTSLEPAGSTP